MIPGRLRFPLEMGAFLFLTFPAVVLSSGQERDRPAAMETSRGALVSIDREERTCAIEKTPGVVETFRLDDDATLVFQGMRLLKVDELRPGMRIEIDNRRAVREEPPVATWIEVLEEKH